MTPDDYSQPSALASPELEQTGSQTAEKDATATITSGTTSCSLCGTSFAGVDEQREHVRSDHHRYNLKARLRGNKILSEAEFNTTIGELDESISGSESESADDEDGQQNDDATLSSLLRRQAKMHTLPEEEESNVSNTKKKGTHPLIWFSSPLLPSTSLGVYRALFNTAEQDVPTNLVAALREKQHPASPYRRNRESPETPRSTKDSHVFMCMIGGGHFAAMIVSLTPDIHKTAGGGEERKPRVIAHKSFHRYTTRRKQGGSQSAMDSANGPAVSAGAMIRRHNELALQSDIRQLLTDWRELIDTADLILVRATGNTNRRVLFGPYEGQVLSAKDPRVRSVPFSTRRATNTELMRVFGELTRLKVVKVDEVAVQAARDREAAHARAQEEKAQAQAEKAKQKQKKKRISPEEQEASLHTSQITALIRRSKAPALLSYLSNNSIPPTFTFHPPSLFNQHNYHHTPTPLHLAASQGNHAIVHSLLTKAHTDPTSRNGDDKPAFDLAADRATRNAFRIARHELGENACDWAAAHVPAPISRADVDARAESEKASERDAEARRRAAETERIQREEAAREAAEAERREGERRQKYGSGRTLAGTARLPEKTAADKREEQLRGMTPEMRAAVEREKRARAAEDRIRKMQARR